MPVRFLENETILVKWVVLDRTMAFEAGQVYLATYASCMQQIERVARDAMDMWMHCKRPPMGVEQSSETLISMKNPCAWQNMAGNRFQFCSHIGFLGGIEMISPSSDGALGGEDKARICLVCGN